MSKSKISFATVLASAGVAAVVSALIVSIGVAGTVASRDSAAPAPQPSTIFLGAAAQPGAPAAGGQAQVPAGQTPAAQAPVAEVPGAVAPVAPEAAAPAAQAPAAPGSPAAQAPTTTAPAVVDAAPQGSTMSIRAAKPEYLYVRSERPTLRTLEWQYAAFWNPRIAMAPKLEVTYKGNTPKVRTVMSQVMQSSQTYDFFSAQGSALPPLQIEGNRMSVVYRGTMAGFPVQSVRYHWIREDGLWKFDWKKICEAIACNGNPDFGY